MSVVLYINLIRIWALASQEEEARFWRGGNEDEELISLLED